MVANAINEELEVTQDVIVLRTITRLQNILGPHATLTRHSELTITGPGASANSVLWTAEITTRWGTTTLRSGETAPIAARRLAAAAVEAGKLRGGRELLAPLMEGGDIKIDTSTSQLRPGLDDVSQVDAAHNGSVLGEITRAANGEDLDPFDQV